jgi:hypothetical protein
VPDNVPNKDMLTAHLQEPLSRIPDPFGTHESFAHHNNAMLREFLDRFGFDYEFVSGAERYNGGDFDEALKGVLRNFDAIMGIMLPTLRKERRKYSPVLPISPSRASASGAHRGGRCRGRSRALCRRDRRGRRAFDSGRTLQAPVEGRLGDALGGAGRRL